MSRVNIYLPDSLADRARACGLNISALAQAAVSAELDRQATDQWLANVPRPRRTVSHEAALKALDEARSDMGDDESA